MRVNPEHACFWRQKLEEVWVAMDGCVCQEYKCNEYNESYMPISVASGRPDFRDINKEETRFIIESSWTSVGEFFSTTPRSKLDQGIHVYRRIEISL